MAVFLSTETSLYAMFSHDPRYQCLIPWAAAAFQTLPLVWGAFDPLALQVGGLPLPRSPAACGGFGWWELLVGWGSAA